MNARPEDQFDEEQRAGERDLSEVVGDEPHITSQDESVTEQAEFRENAGYDASNEINETTEISGNDVPEPVSANRHINQPLIEPAPFETPSEEAITATTGDVSAQLGSQRGETVSAFDSELSGYSPEGGPEQSQTGSSGITEPPIAVSAPVMAPVAAEVPPVQQPYYTQQYPAQTGYTDLYNTGAQSPYYPVEPTPEPIVAPEKGSNRVFGLLFSVLGILIYAGLLLGALIVLGIFSFILTGGLANLTDLMFYPNYYLAVLGFAVAYIILGLLGNRAGWWLYVYGGYFTALGALAGYLIGRFWEDSIWYGTATIPDILFNNLFAPTAVIVLILGREVPVWIGAIVAARGRKLKERYEKEHAAYLEELNTTPRNS